MSPTTPRRAPAALLSLGSAALAVLLARPAAATIVSDSGCYCLFVEMVTNAASAPTVTNPGPSTGSATYATSLVSPISNLGCSAHTVTGSAGASWPPPSWPSNNPRCVADAPRAATARLEPLLLTLRLTIALLISLRWCVIDMVNSPPSCLSQYAAPATTGGTPTWTLGGAAPSNLQYVANIGNVDTCSNAGFPSISLSTTAVEAGGNTTITWGTPVNILHDELLTLSVNGVAISAATKFNFTATTSYTYVVPTSASTGPEFVTLAVAGFVCCTTTCTASNFGNKCTTSTTTSNDIMTNASQTLAVTALPPSGPSAVQVWDPSQSAFAAASNGFVNAGHNLSVVWTPTASATSATYATLQMYQNCTYNGFSCNTLTTGVTYLNVPSGGWTKYGSAVTTSSATAGVATTVAKGALVIIVTPTPGAYPVVFAAEITLCVGTNCGGNGFGTTSYYGFSNPFTVVIAPSASPTPSVTPTASLSIGASESSTVSTTPTPTQTRVTPSLTPTISVTISVTPTLSITASSSQTASQTVTPSQTPTPRTIVNAGAVASAASEAVAGQVGGAVGGIVGLLVVVGVAYVVYQRRQKAARRMRKLKQAARNNDNLGLDNRSNLYGVSVSAGSGTVGVATPASAATPSVVMYQVQMPQPGFNKAASMGQAQMSGMNGMGNMNMAQMGAMNNMGSGAGFQQQPMGGFQPQPISFAPQSIGGMGGMGGGGGSFNNGTGGGLRPQRPGAPGRSSMRNLGL